MFNRIRPFFRSLLRNSRKNEFDRSMNSELQFHIETRAEEFVRGGLSREDALRRARVEFGGVQNYSERCRESRGVAQWLETFAQDLRFGLRMLGKNPGFACVVILTLALGIGVNTAIFSAAQAVFLHSMPFPNAGRLTFISRVFPGSPVPGGNFSYPGSRDIGEQTSSFDAFAAFQNWGSLALTDGVEPVRVEANYVAPRYFSLLNARTAMGRLIRPEENRYESAEHVAVISYGFWERAFGAAPDIIGRTIHLNQHPVTVVGVMSASFDDAVGEIDGQAAPDVWVPLALSPELSGMFNPKDRDSAILWGVGRLKPGVTIAQANQDLAAVAARAEKQYPATDRGFGIVAIPLRDQLVGQFYSAVWLLTAGSVFILLIGCANVANLLLARLIARQREFAVRSALGAGKSRLVGQVLAENLLLTAIAGALGLLFALGCIRGLNSWAHQNLPSVVRFSADRWMLAASMGASLLTGLLFGVGPAVMGAQVDLRDALSQSGRQGAGGRRRVASKFLVAAEVAMAMAMLVGAGLLVKSFRQLTDVNLGFDTKNLLTLRTDLRSARYADLLPRVQFAKQLVENAQAIPGVESATIWGPAMLARSTWVMDAVPEGRDPNDPQNTIEYSRHGISPGALGNLAIHILRGRDFTWQDTLDKPFVAIISDSLAKSFWPGEDPIGKRFHTSRFSNWLTVIGIAADARQRERFNLSDAALGLPPPGIGPQLDIYLPYAQRPNQAIVLALRVQGDAGSVTRAVRDVMRTIDPTLPVYDAAMLDERLASQETSSRSLAALTTLYGALALFLAAFGLFGVLAGAVRSRSQEIGIRMALGAQRSTVLGMVMREGMLLTLVGALGGLVGALLLTRVMTKLLYGVKPTDAATYATVAAVLCAVALAACWLPARRATRVDPIIALRSE